MINVNLIIRYLTCIVLLTLKPRSSSVYQHYQESRLSVFTSSSLQEAFIIHYKNELTDFETEYFPIDVSSC